MGMTILKYASIISHAIALEDSGSSSCLEPQILAFGWRNCTLKGAKRPI